MGTIMGEWRWEKDGSKDGGDMGKLRSFANANIIYRYIQLYYISKELDVYVNVLTPKVDLKVIIYYI